MIEDLFIFGGSGHAKVVIDAIVRTGRDRVALVVDDAKSRHGDTILGCRIEGGREVLLAGRALTPRGIVAIGDNVARLTVATWLEENGFQFITVVHPSAVVAASAHVARGTVVMPMVAINADAQIGRHVIINTAASVDHDCVVGDGAHVGPGCRLCGGVQVGRGALLGAGAVVVPGVRIGAGAFIGAGTVVLHDIPAGRRAVGSPARILAEVP